MIKEINLHLNFIGLGNKKFYIDTDDLGVSNELLRKKCREPLNCYYMSEYFKCLKNNDLLDIGGNIGYFPLIESNIFNGNIIVYEPIKESFKLLKRNVEMCKNVKLFNYGIDVLGGHKEMFFMDNFNNSSMINSSNYFDSKNIKLKNKVVVDTISLYQAIEGLKNVIIRCDIEGYEEKIFKNIPKKVKVLMFEFHTSLMDNPKLFYDRLLKQGFKTKLVSLELDGLTKLFNIFGVKNVLRLYQRFYGQRVFINPNKNTMNEIIERGTEFPHMFMFRR